MPMRFLIAILLVSLLVTACGRRSSTPVVQDAPAPVAPQVEPTAAVEPEATDCLGDEVSPIGKSIAVDYEFTSYDEIMAWFCNGAEFEDILVALESESQTGSPSEDMLQMLADGSTWEEIWQSVGLTN
jgi:hypothetical protein